MLLLVKYGLVARLVVPWTMRPSLFIWRDESSERPPSSFAEPTPPVVSGSVRMPVAENSLSVTVTGVLPSLITFVDTLAMHPGAQTEEHSPGLLLSIRASTR